MSDRAAAAVATAAVWRRYVCSINPLRRMLFSTEWRDFSGAEGGLDRIVSVVGVFRFERSVN